MPELQRVFHEPPRPPRTDPAVWAQANPSMGHPVASMTTADEPVPSMRWACTCGRFVAEADIQEWNVIDPGAYHGVVTEARYRCSRCGGRIGMPRLVEVGTATTTTEESPNA